MSHFAHRETTLIPPLELRFFRDTKVSARLSLRQLGQCFVRCDAVVELLVSVTLFFLHPCL